MRMYLLRQCVVGGDESTQRFAGQLFDFDAVAR
jgi:hypothetical protein